MRKINSLDEATQELYELRRWYQDKALEIYRASSNLNHEDLNKLTIQMKRDTKLNIKNYDRFMKGNHER